MEHHKTAEAGEVGRLRTDQEAYREAFGRFLAGTDETAATHAYLREVVERLPARRVFLDVGAGDGTTTRFLAPWFGRTVCVEPSAPMRRALARAVPQAEVVGEAVDAARVDARADLALLSHVLYYVPRVRWAATVARILEWVAPGGLLLVLLQDPGNACMRMVHHFTGHRFDLRELAGELAALPAGLVAGSGLDVVPACYRSRDLEETVMVAGFHLSVPGGPPVAREAVEAYVRRHFGDGEGGYAFRHDQHVLRVERGR
ncbi:MULTISPECIES: class I SAM-dependent methyltransferase [Streptomyces]|uniref:Class I SAM-dependent methyltransferase n=2 Tax=Streptomyces tricolor TaxID=68277 RepID=A0ABS9JJ37_9ACTN|nr:class I SAM-dependent methyltransferase [Streptomyces tricolor]MCG0065572.1 class I SAM-dependent methyltransferase [Streptomyces tricolor]